MSGMLSIVLSKVEMKECSMTDNLRRYRAIKEDLTQLSELERLFAPDIARADGCQTAINVSRFGTIRPT